VNNTDQQFLSRATEITKVNLHNEQFGVNELAEKLGISRATLHRKIKLITDTTVSQFICQVRLKKALELLKQNSATISETAYDCGFHSVTYFNKCFRDFYGYAPGKVETIQESSDDEILKEIPAGKSNFTWSKKYIFIFTLLIVALTVAVYVNFLKTEKEKRTIVIPVFKDENPAKGDNSLIIFREELHHKLQNIEALNVISSSVTEMPQYMEMDNLKLGKSFNADYILTTKRISANNVGKIYLHLFDSKGNEIWSDDYPDKSEDGNVFDFCAEIALEVASELQISLTPEEKKQILKKPSENLVALNQYNAGIRELGNIYNGMGDIERAKDFFENALQNDSTMAEAYVRMSHIYLEQLRPCAQNREMADCYLDSSKLMADKAIQYDDKNSWGYTLLAKFFNETGNPDVAKKYFALADKYAPRHSGYYLGHSFTYHESGHHYETIESGINYLKLIPGDLAPNISSLILMWYNLGIMGFTETGVSYEKMFCKQIPDSLGHFVRMAYTEMWRGDFKTADDYLQKAFKIDSTNMQCLEQLMFTCNCRGMFKEEYKYLLRAKEIMLKGNDSISPNSYFGIAYLDAGMIEEARFHLDPAILYFENDIEHNLPSAQNNNSFMLVASIYAGLNDKEKTFYYLNTLKTAESNYGWLRFGLSYYPQFDKYRDTPEFQDIYRYIDKQYKKEHQKIEKLLKREGIIES